MKIKTLEQEMTHPDFWHNQAEAQEKSKLLALYQDEVTKIEGLERQILTLENMVKTQESESLKVDFAKGFSELEKLIAKLEVTTYLSGKYDFNPAILSIHAGQGGTEAMDWVQMLERMYLRFAEKKGWTTDIVEVISGEEAGIKSVTIIISGRYSYGYLKLEKGVHRLVRQSPFNADKLRQTSFALVEVLPQIEKLEGLPILESDLEWEFFRASSHGGQNVQKVSTAVRLRHKPTGIIITSQSERYQERNREIALNLLRAKLWQLKQEEEDKEKKSLKGDYKLAGWGNQIRSYVLHPYKMVKDLRTGFEVGDPFAVLDGEIDGFVEAELKCLS